MNKEMIKQISAFNVDYFTIGQAVRIHDKVKNKTFDGLVLSREEDRIGFTIVEWYSPMSGSPGYEARTFYINIQDMVADNFDIELL